MSPPPKPLSRSPSLRLRLFVLTLVLFLLSLLTFSRLPRSLSKPSQWLGPFHSPPPPGGPLVFEPCPRPNRNSAPVDQSLAEFSSHPDWKCRPLPLTNTSSPSSPLDFSAHICTLPTWCNRFSVFIHRSNISQCIEAEAREPVSNDQGLWDWLRINRGPDGFLLRVSGGQRWTSEEGRYEGCGGGVRFDVTLSTGGPIWLEIWRTYENYDHFNEHYSPWPKHHFESLLSAPTRLDICPSGCPRIYAPRAFTPEPSFSVFPEAQNPFSGPGFDGGPHGFDRRGFFDYFWDDDEDEELPDCGTGGPTQGIYMRWHPLDQLEPESKVIPQWQGSRPLMGNYQFIPTRCTYRHAGIMYSPAPASHPTTLHAHCLIRKKKVYFVGDSHARFAYWNLKHRLEGNRDYDSYDDKAGNTERQYHTIGNLDILFQWDHHLGFTGIDDEELVTFDHIVMSAGSWATMENWETSQWLQWYQNVLDKFAALDPDNLRPHVFLIPSPYPPHLTGASVDRGEHRTNIRLGRVRDKMVELIEGMGRGWGIVDQYRMGMPVMLEMLAGDGLHLSPGDAQERIMDDILAKLDICKPIPDWELASLPALPDPLIPLPPPLPPAPPAVEEQVPSIELDAGDLKFPGLTEEEIKTLKEMEALLEGGDGEKVKEEMDAMDAAAGFLPPLDDDTEKDASSLPLEGDEAEQMGDENADAGDAESSTEVQAITDLVTEILGHAPPDDE